MKSKQGSLWGAYMKWWLTPSIISPSQSETFFFLTWLQMLPRIRFGLELRFLEE